VHEIYPVLPLFYPGLWDFVLSLQEGHLKFWRPEPTSLQLQLFVQNAITPDEISPGCHIERMRFVFEATDHILLGNVTSSLTAK